MDVHKIIFCSEKPYALTDFEGEAACAFEEICPKPRLRAASRLFCRVSSVMLGFFPNLYGYKEQFSLHVQYSTSRLWSPQQSRHFALMALSLEGIT